MRRSGIRKGSEGLPQYNKALALLVCYPLYEKSSDDKELEYKRQGNVREFAVPSKAALDSSGVATRVREA
jgi:hypothetical protein